MTWTLNGKRSNFNFGINQSRQQKDFSSGPYRPFGLQARNFTFRRLTVFTGGRTFTSPHNRPNQKFQNHARRTFPHVNGHGDFNDI